MAIVGQDKKYYVLTEEGNVFAKGPNYEGGLGFSRAKLEYFEYCQLSRLQNISKIAVGYLTSIAMDKDGGVFSWGDNSYGQNGRGLKTRIRIKTVPNRIKNLPTIKDISVGGYHSMALDKEGNVWGWGGNANGQLGLDAGQFINKPERITGLPKISAISASGTLSMALDIKGEVWIWGRFPSEHDGNSLSEPKKLNSLKDIVEISCSNFDMMAVDACGKAFTWGWNTTGTDGTIKENLQNCLLVPKEIEGIGKIKKVAGGNEFILMLTEGRGIYKMQDQGKSSSDSFLYTPMKITGVEKEILKMPFENTSMLFLGYTELEKELREFRKKEYTL